MFRGKVIYRRKIARENERGGREGGSERVCVRERERVRERKRERERKSERE
jgi:hypothetical protein